VFRAFCDYEGLSGQWSASRVKLLSLSLATIDDRNALGIAIAINSRGRNVRIKYHDFRDRFGSPTGHLQYKLECERVKSIAATRRCVIERHRAFDGTAGRSREINRGSFACFPAVIGTSRRTDPTGDRQRRRPRGF